MSVDKKTLIGTIDLTPTWAEQAVLCVQIIQNNAYSSETRDEAAKEIIRMGRIIDQHIRKTGAEFAKPDDNDTERWFDATVVGSKYEQQASTKRNWRHRYMLNQSVHGDWIAGRAPDAS